MEQLAVLAIVAVAVVLFGMNIARQAGFRRSGDCGCGKCAEKAKHRIKRQ